MSPELQRWVTSVRARPPRLAAPSPELWNAPKLDKGASLARELHRAGDRVRKWVTHALPDDGQNRSVTPTKTSDTHEEEIVFHVVAHAVPEALLVGGLGDDTTTSASGNPIDDAKQYENLAAFVGTFHPFFSTKSDDNGGVPARVFLGDTKDTNPLEDVDTNENKHEDADDGKQKEKSLKKKNKILPADVGCRGLKLALADARAGERFFVRVAPEYAYLDPHFDCVLLPNELMTQEMEGGGNRRFPKPPTGVRPEDVLFFQVEVLARREVEAVRRPENSRGVGIYPGSLGKFPSPYATKRTLVPGAGWETPRAPFDVTIEGQYVQVFPEYQDCSSVVLRFPNPFPTVETRLRVTVYAYTRSERLTLFVHLSRAVSLGACVSTETVFGSPSLLFFASGDGQLPPELDAVSISHPPHLASLIAHTRLTLSFLSYQAVNTMRVGEQSVVWVPPGPTRVWEPPGVEPGTVRGRLGRKGTKKETSVCSFFSSVSGNTNGVEYHVRLVSIVHVRDVFGDGVVFKRRVLDGAGEFPGDCPVRDCAVSMRFAVRGVCGAEEDEKEQVAVKKEDDSECTSEGNPEGTCDDLFAKFTTRPGFFFHTGPAPLTARLGCGDLPLALETSVRLMIPGEFSTVTFVEYENAKNVRYGYDALRDVSAGASRDSSSSAIGARAVSDFFSNEQNKTKTNLEFLVQLVSFETPVNWYKAELPEMLREAECVCLEGNTLLKKGHTKLACEKYEKALRDVFGLRGLEFGEFESVEAVRRKLTLNLTRAWQRLGEHGKALDTVGRILDGEEDGDGRDADDTEENADTVSLTPNTPNPGTKEPWFVKALWRRAVSLAATHEYAEARRDFRCVQRADRTLANDVARELLRIDKVERVSLAREKQTAQRVLRG